MPHDAVGPPYWTMTCWGSWRERTNVCLTCNSNSTASVDHIVQGLLAFPTASNVIRRLHRFLSDLLFILWPPTSTTTTTNISKFIQFIKSQLRTLYFNFGKSVLSLFYGRLCHTLIISVKSHFPWCTEIILLNLCILNPEMFSVVVS